MEKTNEADCAPLAARSDNPATAAATVDFGRDIGRMRPELHSSGFGPQICGGSKGSREADIAEIKSMGFKASRTHDWGLINPGQRVCDYYNIFPLMHLDAADPANYVFGPTDHLLELTRGKLGHDILFRLGTSIEHTGPKVRMFGNRILLKKADSGCAAFFVESGLLWL